MRPMPTPANFVGGMAVATVRRTVRPLRVTHRHACCSLAVCDQ